MNKVIQIILIKIFKIRRKLNQMIKNKKDLIKIKT